MPPNFLRKENYPPDIGEPITAKFMTSSNMNPENWYKYLFYLFFVIFCYIFLFVYYHLFTLFPFFYSYNYYLFLFFELGGYLRNMME